MSLFSRILNSIFHHAEPSSTTAPGPVNSAPTEISQTTTSPGIPAPVPIEPVDIEPILDGLAAKNSEDLDWKKSIVDLMKLLGIDSSLSARKELAKELSYPGDLSDSASMNVWLHKAVLQKVSENGGKVPSDLLS